jgi:hypothetical protein
MAAAASSSKSMRAVLGRALRETGAALKRSGNVEVRFVFVSFFQRAKLFLPPLVVVAFLKGRCSPGFWISRALSLSLSLSPLTTFR